MRSETSSISPTAFHLRRGEPYLSVEWLEYLGRSGRSEEIQAVIAILSQKLRLGSSARIAVLEVGSVCHYARMETGYSIRFLHEPEPDDPAHSGIHDTAQDEMLLAELIAEKVDESYTVR